MGKNQTIWGYMAAVRIFRRIRAELNVLDVLGKCWGDVRVMLEIC
jgi:hypothetical protein